MTSEFLQNLSYPAGRNDMLTLLAIRWNQQKCQNLATALSQRYHKVNRNNIIFQQWPSVAK